MSVFRVVMLAMILAGCGGGGGGGSGDSTTPVPATSLKWDGGSWDQLNWQ